MIRQKNLSDKIMFSIYLKDDNNVLNFYREYVSYLKILPKEQVDPNDILKIQTEYSNYFNRSFK